MSDAMERQAAALVEAGKLAEARRLLEAPPDNGLLSAEGLRLLAKLRNALGDKHLAVQAMREAMRQKPRLKDGRYELGVMLLDCGDAAAAAEQFRAALDETPDHVAARYNLAWTLRQQGALDAAIDAYHAVVASQPDHGKAWFNLGNALQEAGKVAAALAAYEQARRLLPNDVALLLNLAAAQQAQGCATAAEASLHKALRLAPGHPEVLAAKGRLLADRGETAAAARLLGQAAARRPDNAVLACNWALALADAGKLTEAAAVLAGAAATAGAELGRVLSLMGVVLRRAGRHLEAIQALRAGIALCPAAEAYNNLGRVCTELGRLDDAVAAFRRAHILDPENASIHSNWLFALLHVDSLTPEDLFAEHLRYGAIQERLAGPPPALPAPRPQAGRRLRIGYVSPDFREHAVTTLIEPILSSHDRDRFEVFCYQCSRDADETTARLRATVEHWRNIAALSASAAADLIRQDAIDILIDLAGHTAGNALPVFARKPAHLQITWLGYPATTGLSRMDIRLGLEARLPDGRSPHNTEKLVGLLPFPPFREPLAAPDIGPPPLLSRGHVTFGAASKLIKAGPRTFEVWARILNRVAGARLVILVERAGIETEAPRLRQAFADFGVPAAALDVLPRRPLAEFLALLNDIDIVLDPFPYGGGTTTLFTTWMGVPTVTWGRNEVRQGTSGSILTQVGLGELITDSLDGYESLAVALAGDTERLAEYRKTLRDRLRSSSIMAATAYTRHCEQVLENLWREHVAARAGGRR